LTVTIIQFSCIRTTAIVVKWQSLYLRILRPVRQQGLDEGLVQATKADIKAGKQTEQYTGDVIGPRKQL